MHQLISSDFARDNADIEAAGIECDPTKATCRRPESSAFDAFSLSGKSLRLFSHFVLFEYLLELRSGDIVGPYTTPT